MSRPLPNLFNWRPDKVMTVSSFFPGHIRLRGEMIKDKDIFEAFERQRLLIRRSAKLKEMRGQEAFALSMMQMPCPCQSLKFLKKIYRS